VHISFVEIDLIRLRHMALYKCVFDLILIMISCVVAGGESASQQ